VSTATATLCEKAKEIVSKRFCLKEIFFQSDFVQERMAGINPNATSWTPGAVASATPAKTQVTMSAAGEASFGTSESPYWSPGQSNMASHYVPGAEFVPVQQPSYNSTEFFPSQGELPVAPQAAPEYVPAYVDESAVFVPQAGAAGVEGAGPTMRSSGASNVVTGSSNDFAQGGYDQVLQMADSNGDQYLSGPGVVPAPKKRNVRSFFLPQNIRQRFWHMDALSLRQLKPSDKRVKEIPKGYHGVNPLDASDVPTGTAGSFGYPSSIYKVVSEKDGLLYALRRFDNIKTTPQITARVIGVWEKTEGAKHPNVITIRSAFVHQRALFFTHDYWPGAKSLYQLYFESPQPQLIPESTLWAYTWQIVAAIQHVHVRNLACRAVHLRRILVTGPNRVRLYGIGILDVLEHDSKVSLGNLQQDDMMGLGRVLLQLATCDFNAHGNMQKSMDLVGTKYSKDFGRLVMGLLLQVQKVPTVFEVSSGFSGQMLAALDGMYTHGDAVENEMRKQFGCGRMARLFMKLGMINERPEMAMDKQWSETGDRYILKLFRNYVFHQRGRQGEPVIDFGHIMECMMKLDTGDTEKILLTSPDGKSIMVATYFDIRQMLNDSFIELVRNGSGPGVNETSSMYATAEHQMLQAQVRMYDATQQQASMHAGLGYGGAYGAM
jgi:PAB-dependent poly(A)-specific ribonuclease subunit 3